jgi:para-nitrobenzyl esterase
MSAAWAAFARTGDPSHEGIPRWPPYDARRRATMFLDAECRVAEDPHRAERLPWDQVGQG